MEQTIPVVDLDDFLCADPDRRARFVDELGGALATFGFVAVTNHHVDQGALRNTYEAVERFFALPVVDKQRYELEGGIGERGYTSFGMEHAKDTDIPDLKEFWHVGPTATGSHFTANLWPDEVPELRPASLALWQSLFSVAEVLVRAIAQYLKVDEDEWVKMIDGGETILRMIQYPPPATVDFAPKEAVWAAEHEDINLITLLIEASAPGLQILTREGEWLPINPVPGQMIADAGDMLQRLTNGRIPATTHRVLAPHGVSGPRFSMPFFVHPRPETVLAPVPGTVTADHPRRWADTTASDYFHNRMARIGFGADGGPVITEELES